MNYKMFLEKYKNLTSHFRDLMKKWLVLAIIVMLLSGCSWRSITKWIDEMEWERDDEIVRVVDIFIK